MGIFPFPRPEKGVQQPRQHRCKQDRKNNKGQFRKRDGGGVQDRMEGREVDRRNRDGGRDTDRADQLDIPEGVQLPERLLLAPALEDVEQLAEDQREKGGRPGGGQIPQR